MLSNLYFLSNYNNYYNREIKRKATLAEYIDDRDDTQLYSIYNYNFEMNDGVISEVIVNFPVGAAVIDFRDHYLVVEEQMPDEPFLSRWFVVETVKIREGQFRVGLRRDLVADFLDPLLAATVYVEKGRITQNILAIQEMNPLAFNQEPFTANQIKKREIPIKDKLGCKWIVGYINKGYNKVKDNPDAEEDKTIVSHTNLGTVPNTSVATEADIAYLNKYKTTPISYPTALTASFKYMDTRTNEVSRIEVGETNSSWTLLSGGRAYVSGKHTARDAYIDKFLYVNNYDDMFDYALDKYYGTWAVDKAEWFRVLGLNNKTILVRDVNKTYRCIVTKQTMSPYSAGVSQTNDPIWYDNLKAYAKRPYSDITVSDSDDAFSVSISRSEGLMIQLVDIENENYSCVVPTTRNRTLQEAFDAFAIPYVDDKAIAFHLENVGIGEITSYKGALAIAQEICDTAADTIDLQLLPFCPLPEEMIAPTYLGPDWTEPYKSDYMITVVSGMVNITASPIRDAANNVKNVIFWLSTTEFSTIIPYTDTNDYSTVEKVKAINQLDTWRLESGDYSSSFEFNMARNGGVQYFEVDCKYKPYQPYIHIAPNFGGLYGSDYNDTRGLVCSNTNYSLPRLTDTWENYERNNLNYMNSFNRQIQNMDVNRKYQKGAEIASMIAGAGSGAASGAIAGSIIPGVGTAVGGAIGAVLGTATSLGAGIADTVINENLYKENKQYAIDQFNMSLQNIQALPNTMVAAGALNPNNKIFPVLSYYTCSNIEREAFLQKMRWNGMTIGVITDNIADYIGSDKTYFKGSLVYMDTETTDIGTHEMSELANELAKGIIFDEGVIE